MNETTQTPKQLTVPHQYECRISSSGIRGARVGGKLIVGLSVTGARVLVVGVSVGLSVGDVGLFVGESEGFKVGLLLGLIVNSAMI